MAEETWAETISNLGVVGVLLMFTWAAMSGRLIWEWAHREIVEQIEKQYQERLDDVTKDRDQWREVALRATSSASQASGAASLIAEHTLPVDKP